MFSTKEYDDWYYSRFEDEEICEYCDEYISDCDCREDEE